MKKEKEKTTKKTNELEREERERENGFLVFKKLQKFVYTFV